MKHFLKRSVSALLVLVLLVSALSGLAFAADDAYLSLRAEKTGDKEVTVTVTTLKRLENIGSIDAVFTVPAGFTLKQDSMTSDLSNYGTFNASLTPGWFTSSKTAGDNIDAGITLYNAVFETADTITAGIPYTFSVLIKDAADFDLNNHALMNASASATLTIAPAPVAVSSITLNKDAFGLTVGDSETLTATVNPKNATDKTVTWSSDNENAATVDANGKVTAVGEGEAIITATANDGSGVTASCKVTVTAKPVPVTAIALADAKVSVGSTVQLTPKFTPAGTTQTGLTWESSELKTSDRPVSDTWYEGISSPEMHFLTCVRFLAPALGAYFLGRRYVPVEMCVLEAWREPSSDLRARSFSHSNLSFA